MHVRPTRSGRLHTYWILTILLSATALDADPTEGPPFPRIANVYGTALTANGGRFHGEETTLDEVARYDLLIGVGRPPGGTKGDAVFRKQLARLKEINPHLIALHFACSAPYTHIAPKEEAIFMANQAGPSTYDQLNDKIEISHER
jgi:hypothetical protein